MKLTGDNTSVVPLLFSLYPNHVSPSLGSHKVSDDPDAHAMMLVNRVVGALKSSPAYGEP